MRHNPITLRDVKACLNDYLCDGSIGACVHSMKTRDTKNEGKSFKTIFDIWVKPTAKVKDDSYLSTKLATIDTAVHEVVQQHTWLTASENEHAASGSFTRPTTARWTHLSSSSWN